MTAVLLGINEFIKPLMYSLRNVGPLTKAVVTAHRHSQSGKVTHRNTVQKAARRIGRLVKFTRAEIRTYYHVTCYIWSTKDSRYARS
jgi:hypothetical protein